MLRKIINTLGPIGFLCQLAVAYLMVVEVSYRWSPLVLDTVNNWKLINNDGSMLVTLSVLAMWIITALVVQGIVIMLRESWTEFWEQ